jgi:hypothetical protein
MSYPSVRKLRRVTNFCKDGFGIHYLAARIDRIFLKYIQETSLALGLHGQLQINITNQDDKLLNLLL